MLNGNPLVLSSWFAAKPLILVVAAGAGIWDMLELDSVRATLVTLAAIAALCVYRVFKKFRREAITSKLDFLDRNLVELILFCVIAPNAAKTLTEWARLIFSALP